MDEKKSVPKLRMITIGVDSAIIGYILTKPESVNFSVDICRSLEDAQIKIHSSFYDFYLFDGGLSELSIFILVDEIRKKETKKSTIALILDRYPEESDLKKLRDEKKIDYILERLKLREHLDLILKNICEIKVNKVESTQLQDFKRKYEETIDAKITLMAELIKSAQQNPGQIKELKLNVHKVAGSAGSFGYGSVSDLCKAMETEINKRIDSDTFNDAEWLSSLNEFLKKFKEGFQRPIFEKSPLITTPIPLPKAKPLFFVVDDDVNFLELLGRVKDSFSIELVCEFDPQKAVQQLILPGFNPQALIASQTFRSSSLSGLDIIKSQMKKESSAFIFSAILLEKGSIDVRLEIMQNGVDYIFSKPVSASFLLKSMSDVMQNTSLAPAKVLVLDDDQDFCNYVIATLSEINVETCAIYEANDLYQKLQEFRPDILLLDLILPKYDGMNLLKTLKQDIAYRNLIVVIVTASEHSDVRVNAYAANVDDILFKPIDSKILQKRILSIVNRRNSVNEFNNNYTGLPSLSELKENLSSSLEKQGRVKPTLVLFQVHNFTEWAKQYGSVEDLIILISNQLQWERDNTMICYWLKESVFAILFEGVELDNIQQRTYGFMTRLVQVEIKWHLLFDCAIVPISKDFENPSKILEMAGNSLVEASKKEEVPVKMVSFLPNKGDIKREIVIIDPDRNLLKILKQAFESHGLLVKTYGEGGDALKDLLTLTENCLPSLIIMERNLPDMDGMDLYLKLNNRFRMTIPFFILTVFSADKDVSEGIEKGVLEYIIKPFNISILVKKALQVIFVNK